MFPADLPSKLLQKSTGISFVLWSSPQQVRNQKSWKPWYMTNSSDEGREREKKKKQQNLPFEVEPQVSCMILQLFPLDKRIVNKLIINPQSI